MLFFYILLAASESASPTSGSSGAETSRMRAETKEHKLREKVVKKKVAVWLTWSTAERTVKQN